MNHQHQSVGDRTYLRVGAGSAVLGVVAALVQSALDPSYSDDPTKAIQQASLSHFLTLSRILDMTSFLLLLVGVVAITKVLSAGRGASWARVARTLFTVSAASGAIATMIVGSLPDVARSWAEANPALKPGYIAVYDALGDVSGGVFAVSWASLGIFGIVLSVALSRDDDFPKALTWISAASGVALASAVAAGVGFQVSAAFALLLLGLLLSYVVLVASSVRIWVLAARSDSKTPVVAEPVGNGSTP